MRLTVMALIGSMAIMPEIYAANEGCVIDGDVLACDLRLGATQYIIDGSQTKRLQLTNNTGTYTQINQVWSEPVLTGYWGEYCAYINDMIAGQTTPGVGEVGCTHKDANEPAYGALQWDGYTTALALTPGSVLHVGGYVWNSDANPPGKDYRTAYYVSVYPESSGVISYRQPRNDEIIPCDGTKQSTSWAPWKNTTGRNLVLTGAMIFAVDPVALNTVDEACIAVLDSTGANVRWQYCNNVNSRGRVDFPDVVVAPNEYIGGQANNTCAAGADWDWGSFIYTYYQ